MNFRRLISHVLLFTGIQLACTAALKADRDVTPIQGRVFASPNGSHFLILAPVSISGENWMWTTFKVDERGLFKESWCVDGIYAREIFLADDGNHLVCLETWPHGKPAKDAIVMTVYEQGRLVKAVHLSQVVRNLDELPTSTSHYRWLEESRPPFVRGPSLFFKTVEGESYQLNMSDGSLKLNFDDERKR